MLVSNNNKGYIISDKGGPFLLRSVNNVDNWGFSILSYPFYDVHFIDIDHGFASGGYVIDSHGPSVIGDIFITDDGGETWDVSLSTQDPVHSAFFVDDFKGYAVEGRAINKTIDGGNTWSAVYISENDSIYHFYGNDLFFLNEDIGWSTGVYVNNETETHGSALLGTIDGGWNWNIEWTHPNPDENSYDYGLSSIHFVNSTGWAVGKKGIIVKYTDRDQWQLQSSVTDLPLNKVFFSEEQHGWIAGGYFNEDNEYLILLKTTDGGENWQEIPNFNYEINDMYFENNLHGWAVGNDTSYSGMILETEDGGDNWSTRVEGLSTSLTALHFKDGYGWAVGGNGLVLRTEDGASWVDQNTGKTYPTKFSLSQNYPNPFNPGTAIGYQLSALSQVELSIYNLLGQKVVTLVSERQQAGYHQVEWDASGVASGIYYYRIEAGKFQKVRKMIHLK